MNDLSKRFLSDFIVDKAEAIKIANKVLHDRWSHGKNPDPDNPLVIVEEATIEEEWVWVFFYNYRKAIETQDKLEDCLCSSPIIIDKIDGSVHKVVGRSLEKFLIEYQKVRVRPNGWPKVFEIEESR